MLGKKQKSAFHHTEGGGEVIVRKREGKRGSGFSENMCSVLLLACFSLLSACATSSDIDLLRQDVSKIQRDSLSVRNDVNSLKEKTTGVAKEESFNVMRQSQAELQSTVANLSRDTQVLSGRLDEHKYFVERTLKERSAEMDILRAQMTALEKQMKTVQDRLIAIEMQARQQREIAAEQPAEAEAKKEESQQRTPAREAQPMKTAAPSDKLAKYDAAYNAFKSKKYKESREKFEQFVKDFPGDKLSENAHFWIAETYYNEKDHEGAILAYETFLKKYPKSDKAPSSLLKQGLAFIGIGDKKTGKVILEQLLERYPKSKEAELAKKQINDLNKKPVKKKK
jgi:tol-pal system protein YbgF